MKTYLILFNFIFLITANFACRDSNTVKTKINDFYTDSLIFRKKIDSLFLKQMQNNSVFIKDDYQFAYCKNNKIETIFKNNENNFPYLYKFPWYEVTNIDKEYMSEYLSNSNDSQTLFIAGFSRFFTADNRIYKTIKIEKWIGLDKKSIEKIDSMVSTIIHFKNQNHYSLLRESGYELQLKTGENYVFFVEVFLNCDHNTKQESITDKETCSSIINVF